MVDTKKHSNDVGSGAKVQFQYDECEKKFTTKQHSTIQ